MKPITPWVLIVGFLWGTASYAAENSAVNAALPSMKVQVSNAPDFYYLDGHVEAVNQSTLSAQTSGTIEKLYYDVDDYVEKGSVIARIKSKNQQAGVQQAKAGQAEAEASYAEAKARLAEADAAFKRISDIYARRLVPRADYDNAEATLKAAQAQVRAAEARTVSASAQATQAGEQLGYTTLIAPYAGIVTKRFVQLGETVNPGTPIMSGISLDQLRVVVEVPQRMINAIRKEKKAFVFQDGTSTSLPVKDLTFFPYADPTTNAEAGNGIVYVGAVFPASVQTTTQLFEKPAGDALGHVLGISTYEPGNDFVYYWGSGWSKYGFEKAEDWTNYLKDYAEKVRNPLVVTVQK